ncbi:diacylglycerol/lipid kinase family protein [Kutzneria albida]|uniref:Sphingosine kinase/diacylglycerol kinase n=1 Tax=Kutzneria albida DSM 43870 TaxID=1449976 RepID=W5W7A6_9PSEU|nr:YegS/Rv2252/BmrU family lipid kinase [Kutzneria albida]AHH96426.1 sphingosine kinase/diacylglycerol kinase [Kutzneria albida DSM 43870]
MRIALLVCPASGLGAAGRVAGTVAARLRQISPDVQPFVARDAEGTARFAHEAVTGGADVLAVLGGDGAAHAAVQACAGSQTALAIIPAGTGNDFARAFSLSLDGVDEALRQGSRRQVDLGRVRGGAWFGTVLCAGFDSRVNERANQLRWPRGPRRYDLAVLAEIAQLRADQLVVRTEHESLELDATLIAVGNTPYYGGGIPVCPDADPADGLLDVTIARRVGRGQLVRILPQLRAGRHTDHPAVTTLRARSLTIEGNDWVGYADGERQRELPLHLDCVPNALTLVA